MAGSSRGRAGRVGVLAAVAAGGLLAALAAVPASAAAGRGHGASGAPPLPREAAARHVGVLHPRPPVPPRAVRIFRASRTHWPAAGSANIAVARALPPLTGKQAPGQIFGGPVGPWAGGHVTPALVRGAPGSAVASVRASVASQRAAQRLGIRGVVFTARAAAGSASGRVDVGLDYAGFSQAYGANFGDSLGLAELPACALTTPRARACRHATPLTSVNDPAASRVWAAVTLPARPHGGAAAAMGPAIVVAAMNTYTDGGGALGTDTATSLKPSGTWTGGGSSGSFTYSYPMQVPPAAGGLAPQVSLDYDSGSVDGQTAATQAQSSWVGDGWTTSTDAYIEQSFKACQDDPEGSAAPQSTPDMCYDGPVLTLSLDGSSTPLVCPVPFSYTASSTCHAADDPGEVITHHVSSGNGQGANSANSNAAKFSDYWTVTTTSGTTYTFGLNHLPGWASGDQATDSVDTEPVFSAHSGDPCYSSSGFAASVCTMAYRWNLDYVTDLHHNAMAYFYDQSVNAYDQYGTTAAVSYDRDSYLDHIFYGFTDGNAYATGAATGPADEVAFGTGDRCFTGTCDPLNSSDSANWDDTPYSDYCATGSTSCQTNWPSFWSTARLASVTTEQRNGAGAAPSAFTTVDKWALSQSFPANPDGTEPTLWLGSITRTGEDATAGATAGALVPVPAVTFTPKDLPNRVNPGTYFGLYRNRIGTITTETGSQIKVAYENTTPTCSPGQTAGTNYPSNPAANTWSCFPVYWGTFTSPNPDWFYKYAVSSVQVTDPGGGSPGLYTSYQYGGPAWHYDDNEVVQAKDRTYGQWRGYQHVYTFNGNGDPLTETGAIYYQGMSDDNNSTDVTVTDLTGQKHEDADQLAGDLLEQTSYDYASTASPASPTVNNSTIDSYWVSAAAATRTQAGLPALTSNYTGIVEDWAEQELTDASPATYRITETDTSYDTATSDADFGLPLFILSHGDVSQPAQATCTTLTYAAPNTAANLTGLVSETEVDAAPCSGANPGGTSMPASGQVNDLGAPSGMSKPADVISDTRTYYDDPPVLTGGLPAPGTATWPQAAPGNADSSVTEKATNYSGGAFIYLVTGATAYDSYGRPVTAYDANGNKTATSYTMTNGSTTAQTITNPLSQATTTTYDPARGLPVTVTDPNNIVTTEQYDELGRLTSEWDNGRAATSSASVTYSYALGTAATPTVVTTKTLDDSSGYITSTALYDALLRLRQTQYPTPQGGSLVTDNFYDTRGFTWKVNHSWWDASQNPGTCPQAPTGSPCIWTVPDSQVPDQTSTQFDGLGRPVIVTDYDDSAVRSVAYTEYTGDKVITIPAATGTTPITPVGATPTAVTTDGLGRTTETDSYTSWPSVTTGTNAGGFPTVSVTGGTTQATTDSYNSRGWLATTATGGQQWTSSYDLFGQVTSSTSPNAGTTSMSYDNNGNLTQATDQLGHTITTTYDALNRETGEYDGTSSSAPPIATWTYDNSNNVSGVTDPVGQLTTENAYDQNGDEFTFQQSGFNAFGESLGETVTVPADQGALAGTYTLSHTYTPTTGLPLKDTYPASPGGGSLPAETLTRTYITGFGLPSGLGGLAAYAQATTYTAWSQVAREEIGSTTANAYITNTYDANTGDLTDTQVANTAVTSTPYDDTSYQYDPAGNVTGEQDVRNGTQTELQCFAYSTLDQLMQAWTTSGSPACASGPPAAGSTITDGIPGGAYWTKWAYNTLGNQTSQSSESVTGGTASTTSYNYASSGQPDTLTSSTGATTASYTYNADGETLTRDIPSGNQTLTWTDNGKLSTDTIGSNKTTYIYDGEGDLLAADNPASTTLYIFGEQLTATSSGTVTGIRFIPLPGGGQAVRTGAGTSYYFETSDQHGTSLLDLASNAQSPVWRQFTPYGAPRGTTTGSWPDTNGYLGDPVNANTSLTTIGARQYDPATGRFLSVDPVLEAGDPNQMGGYAYAADNPATGSDPTGLCAAEPGHPCVGNPLPPSGTPGSGDTGCDADPAACTPGPGSSGSTGGTGGGSQAPGTGILPKPVQYRYQSAYASYATNSELTGSALELAALEDYCDSGGNWGSYACGRSLSLSLLGDYESMVAPTAVMMAAAQNTGGDSYLGDSAVRIEVTASDDLTQLACGGESFTASTAVLLANGRTMPISKLKIGDKILAYNTRTGRSQTQAVTAVLAHYDHDLYNLTIRTASGTTVIHATARHLFWNPATARWVTAASLAAGTALATPHGQPATVTSGRAPADTTGWMWDLTVAADHDFYVLGDSATATTGSSGQPGGAVPVLVHNCAAGPNVPNAVKAAIEDIQNGGGVPRTQSDGSQTTFTGWDQPLSVQRRWAGSLEYEVPGMGNNYRILYNPKYGSYGWTSTHYQGGIFPYNPAP